jgi:uncharacterized protein YdgA (DUF945 family)
LVKLAQSVDERMDTPLSWINRLGEAQANSEAKIAALADSQLRTEEIQRNSERKIDALADAQIRTEGALTQLLGRQDRTDERLNQLIQAQQRTQEHLDQLMQAQLRFRRTARSTHINATAF